MSEIIEITILGQPVGKQFTGRNPISKKYYKGHKTDDYYERIQSIFFAKYPHHKLLAGALIVDYQAFYTIYPSWTKKKQTMARQGEIRPTTKPDWDNIGKIFDALNKKAWTDDAIIVDGRVRKWYSMKPRVEVTIYEWRFE